jgi:hypothetical protein
MFRSGRGKGKYRDARGGGELNGELFTCGSPKQNTLARLPFGPSKFHPTYSRNPVHDYNYFLFVVPQGRFILFSKNGIEWKKYHHK